MRRICGATVILLVLGASSAPLRAQDTGDARPSVPEEPAFHLDQNYPNPFSASTRIPFVLDASLFSRVDSAVVSLRIYNVLQQRVAVPTAINHPTGSSMAVERLVYTMPGRKEAFWDGRDEYGRYVPSGVYYYQLIVNGRSRILKMVVSR